MKKLSVGLVVAVIWGVAVACGGDTEGAADTSADAGASPTQIKVAYPPAIVSAPLFIARDQGFFEKHQLDVELVPGGSAAAQLQIVVSGDVQFSQSTPPVAMTAAGQGLPIRVVAAGAETGAGKEDTTVIAVPDGSDVKSLKDLEGKTVNVISFKSSAELGTRELLKRDGVDLSKVQFVAVPFTETPAALKTGRVDASFLNEPYLTIAQSQGAEVLSPAFSAITAGESVARSNWITTARYLEDNPDVVRRFVAAMYEANAYANDHPEEVRSAAREFTEIEPAILNKIRLGSYPDNIDVEDYKDVWLPLLLKYNPPEDEPNVDELVVPNLGGQ